MSCRIGVRDQAIEVGADHPGCDPVTDLFRIAEGDLVRQQDVEPVDVEVPALDETVGRECLRESFLPEILEAAVPPAPRDCVVGSSSHPYFRLRTGPEGPVHYSRGGDADPALHEP